MSRKVAELVVDVTERSTMVYILKLVVAQFEFKKENPYPTFGLLVYELRKAMV